MMIETSFKSVKEIAEWLKKVPFETSLSFCSDTEEDIKDKNDLEEAFTTWYVVTKTEMYGGSSLIFGIHGFGILCSHYYEEDDDIIELLKVFFKITDDFGFNNVKIKVCIDTEEWENGLKNN